MVFIMYFVSESYKEGLVTALDMYNRKPCNNIRCIYVRWFIKEIYGRVKVDPKEANKRENKMLLIMFYPQLLEILRLVTALSTYQAMVFLILGLVFRFKIQNRR